MIRMNLAVAGMAIFAAAIFSGCVQVNADVSGFSGSDYKTEKSGDPKSVSEEKARGLADDLAKEHGARLSEFNRNSKRVDDAYWVVYDSRDDRAEPGGAWPKHFAVHVDPMGNAVIYKNAGATSGKMLSKKVDDDKAKDIAKELAKSSGVKSDQYKLNHKEIDKAYWVMFDKKDGGTNGWPAYFLVRVSPYGQAVLFK